MEETIGSRGLDPTHSCKKLDMLTFNFKSKCPASLAKMESGRFIERLCIKKYRWSDRERHLDVNLWPLY